MLAVTSLKDFRLDLSELSFVGHDLVRPECVVAEPDGTLWVSDARGVATRIDPDGRQTLLGPEVGEPNGIAIDRDGSLVVATMAGRNVVRLRRDGQSEILLDRIDGAPLGAANFCFRDRQDRLWIAVMTRQNPWWGAIAGQVTDGYIVLVDEKGPRIVADNIMACNEIRLDASGQWLYAAETLRARMLRFPVRADGSLGEREVYGPDGLGQGAYVDGFAIDAEGNLWVTTVCRNGLVVITPDGSAHTVFEDANEAIIPPLIEKMAAHTSEPMDLVLCAGKTLQLPTSVAFGGPDLRTVYMGSLMMPRLASFRSPVPGLPLAHWA